MHYTSDKAWYWLQRVHVAAADARVLHRFQAISHHYDNTLITFPSEVFFYSLNIK